MDFPNYERLLHLTGARVQVERTGVSVFGPEPTAPLFGRFPTTGASALAWAEARGLRHAARARFATLTITLASADGATLDTEWRRVDGGVTPEQYGWDGEPEEHTESMSMEVTDSGGGVLASAEFSGDTWRDLENYTMERTLAQLVLLYGFDPTAAVAYCLAEIAERQGVEVTLPEGYRLPEATTGDDS